MEEDRPCTTYFFPFDFINTLCDARNHHNAGFHFYNALPKVDNQDLLEYENVVIINKLSDIKNIWNLIVIFSKMFRIELIDPEPSEQSIDLLYTVWKFLVYYYLEEDDIFEYKKWSLVYSR